MSRFARATSFAASTLCKRKPAVTTASGAIAEDGTSAVESSVNNRELVSDAGVTMSPFVPMLTPAATELVVEVAPEAADNE